MKNTKISWCDNTFNPWIGCTKVSSACANCYAAAMDHRWGHDSFGAGKPRRRTSEEYWGQPLGWNAEVEQAMDRRERAMLVAPSGSILPNHPATPRVFCASLADWLDGEVPIEWLADLLALIHATPYLDWLLLTKRPENWARRVEAASLCEHNDRNEYYGRNVGCWMANWLRGDAPENVWVGTTVEYQDMADERIPALLKIPARIRFLSCEPLLGPVQFGHIPPEGDTDEGERIHWVICGGESGPNARPMHPDWARSLRDQCKAAGVPFFFKQWGAWAPRETRPDDARFMGDEGEFKSCGGMVRNTKRPAGCLLDGNGHKEFPQ
ncbi:MAG: phage Gp37/Gp68 family protein [Opitutaceae bacterium]|jgi:protein gp37